MCQLDYQTKLIKKIMLWVLILNKLKFIHVIMIGINNLLNDNSKLIAH